MNRRQRVAAPAGAPGQHAPPAMNLPAVVLHVQNPANRTYGTAGTSGTF
jgi:hypothetical protein